MPCNTLILSYWLNSSGGHIRTATFTSPFPMLVVANLKRATRWYQKALGFRLLWEMPGLSHLRCPRDGHLLLMGDGETAPVSGTTLTFGISTGSVDELAETAVARGADILVGPVDQPWNRREVTLKDPDGHRLTFTQTQRRSLADHTEKGERNAEGN